MGDFTFLLYTLLLIIFTRFSILSLYYLYNEKKAEVVGLAGGG